MGKVSKKNAKTDGVNKGESRPNILMIMVDQLRFPSSEMGSGFLEPIKELLGFKDVADIEQHPFKDQFPGFVALRKNAAILNNHRIATSACVPSRTVLFTGQYGTHTGVTQTDGMFKHGTDKEFSWLDPEGIPMPST